MKYIALILTLVTFPSFASADYQENSLETEVVLELKLEGTPSAPPCYEWKQELQEISSIARACARNGDKSNSCRSVINRVRHLNRVLGSGVCDD